MTSDREYLFNYRFGGAEWGIIIHARDPDEAREKIKAVGMARYEGEMIAKIPASIPGSGLLLRLLCWWKGNRHG